MDTLDKLYNLTLDYIYSFIENSLTHQPDLTIEEADLTRIQTLVHALGDPQRAYPSIHVAGSKGKGSVSAFCAAALQAEGYKVGLYTSPHLKDFEERIQINRKPIPRADFIDLFDQIRPFVAQVDGLTTFELVTAAAFLYFQQQNIDVAVIEVGLGGRVDATNVIMPVVSVITALYLEHTAILGKTLDKIAYQKAGIIKPQVPVVLSPQRPEAAAVVVQIAAEKNAPLTRMKFDYDFEPLETSLDGQRFTLQSLPEGELLEFSIGLLGQHQIENASTAYVALQKFAERSLPVSEASIHEGFAQTEWAARFEVLHRAPPVVVDSAHNPDSARQLRETISEYFPGRTVTLILGVSVDKDIGGIIAELAPCTRQVICTQSTHPRAMETQQLVERMTPFGIPTKGCDQVGDALQLALDAVSPNTVILVTGSIFVAATGRIAWYERFAARFAASA